MILHPPPVSSRPSCSVTIDVVYYHVTQSDNCTPCVVSGSSTTSYSSYVCLCSVLLARSARDHPLTSPPATCLTVAPLSTPSGQLLTDNEKYLIATTEQPISAMPSDEWFAKPGGQPAPPGTTHQRQPSKSAVILILTGVRDVRAPLKPIRIPQLSVNADLLDLLK